MFAARDAQMHYSPFENFPLEALARPGAVVPVTIENFIDTDARARRGAGLARTLPVDLQECIDGALRALEGILLYSRCTNSFWTLAGSDVWHCILLRPLLRLEKTSGGRGNCVYMHAWYPHLLLHDVIALFPPNCHVEFIQYMMRTPTIDFCQNHRSQNGGNKMACALSLCRGSECCGWSDPQLAKGRTLVRLQPQRSKRGATEPISEL